jgi:hypothetical protein
MSYTYTISRFELNEILNKYIAFFDVKITANNYTKRIITSIEPQENATNEELATAAFENIAADVNEFYNENKDKIPLEQNIYTIIEDLPKAIYANSTHETAFAYGGSETAIAAMIIVKNNNVIMLKIPAIDHVATGQDTFVSTVPLDNDYCPDEDVYATILVDDCIDGYAFRDIGQICITSDGHIRINSVQYSLINYNGLSDQDFHNRNDNCIFLRGNANSEHNIGWPAQTITYII